MHLYVVYLSWFEPSRLPNSYIAPHLQIPTFGLIFQEKKNLHVKRTSYEERMYIEKSSTVTKDLRRHVSLAVVDWCFMCWTDG